MKRVLLLALLLSSVATACGSDAGHEHSAGGTDHPSMDHGGSISGSPAAKKEATREVVVIASDDLRFDPSSIAVEAGDVITFVVRNEGKTEHEFVLGDEAYQDMHEQDMSQGEHMMGMDNGVTVAPGETAELTWRFDGTGEVLYGCHEPGHYDGGMVGTVAVG